MIWILWHGGLACRKELSQDGPSVIIKGLTSIQIGSRLETTQWGNTGGIVERSLYSVPSTPKSKTTDRSQDGSMFSCCWNSEKTICYSPGPWREWDPALLQANPRVQGLVDNWLIGVLYLPLVCRLKCDSPHRWLAAWGSHGNPRGNDWLCAPAVIKGWSAFTLFTSF